MADLNLTGYKLTFSDEFNTRSISATGEGTTWADMRSAWVMGATARPKWALDIARSLILPQAMIRSRSKVAH